MMPTGWTHVVGEHPDQVEVYEDLARKGVVYVRWRIENAAGERVYTSRSLGFAVRDARGRLITEKVNDAKDRAKARYRQLLGAADTPARTRALTLGSGITMAFHPERGRWAKSGQHQKDMRRALNQAASVWGVERTFVSLKKADFRELWRKTLKKYRAQGDSGHRVTEIVVLRVLTLAGWLREEGEIPPVAWLPWKHWRDEVREDVGEVTIHRPRFTLEEMRALLRTCRDVDPRWELLLELGSGLRLGQVRRAYRSWLTIHGPDVPAADMLDLKRATRKGKKGAVRLLTRGQRAAFTKATARGGYLETLEAQYQALGIDYPVFPGGALPRDGRGRLYANAKHASRAPIDARTLQEFFQANEFLAGITHEEGRGWTGLRRITVDQGKMGKISREALKELGGWATTQMPDAIYADEEATPFREEARDVVARIRGETEE
ncbi:MAG: hypothetical protein WC700_01985 [Gemmatimonadaceae bacterium]